MLFVERTVYSATSLAKRESLFSRSLTGTSYSAILPASIQTSSMSPMHFLSMYLETRKVEKPLTLNIAIANGR